MGVKVTSGRNFTLFHSFDLAWIQMKTWYFFHQKMMFNQIKMWEFVLQQRVDLFIIPQASGQGFHHCKCTFAFLCLYFYDICWEKQWIIGMTILGGSEPSLWGPFFCPITTKIGKARPRIGLCSLRILSLACQSRFKVSCFINHEACPDNLARGVTSW